MGSETLWRPSPHGDRRPQAGEDRPGSPPWRRSILVVAPRGSVWPPTLLGRPTGRAVSVLTPLATIGPEQKTRWAPWGRFAAGGSFTLILRTVSGDALLPPHPPPPLYTSCPRPRIRSVISPRALAPLIGKSYRKPRSGHRWLIAAGLHVL